MCLRVRATSRGHSSLIPTSHHFSRVRTPVVGTLRRVKWRVRGVPSSAYADALERVRTSMTEAELGEAPVHIDAEFADVEDVPGDDHPEETGE